MLKELFNPASYFFNPYAIPNFIVSTYCFFLAILVLSKKKAEGLSLFSLLYTTGVWLIGFAFMYSTASPRIAYIWDKILYVSGVCFISINAVYLSLDVTGRIKNKRDRLILIGGYLIMASFAAMVIFTDLIVQYPPIKFFWGYYTNVGPLQNLFLFFWVLYALQGTFNIYTAYKKETRSLERNRLRIFLFAWLFGCIGAIDFVPNYKIEVYPFGYIFGATYLTLFFYNFIRHKALGIETVVHKTLLWVTSIVLIIFPVGMGGAILLRVFANNFPLAVNVPVLCALLVLFAHYYFYLRPKIDYFFGKRQYAYHELLGRISEKVSTTLEIETFSRKLLDELDACILPQKTILWLIDEEKKHAWLFAQKFLSEEVKIYKNKGYSIPGKDVIIKYLQETNDILEPPIIALSPQFQDLRKSPFFDLLQKENIEVLVPLLMEERLVGILGLGKKTSLRVYAKVDLEILKTLGRELGTSMYNALHHQDILEKQRLQQEIFLAKNIQETLLPKEPPRIPGIKLYGLYAPAKEIGGDYYDFLLSPRETGDKVRDIYITIGDVSGKGLDAGLVVSSIKSSLLALIGFMSSPKEILIRLNNILFEEIKEQKFVSLLLFMYESKQGILKYSSCGHEHIIMYRQGRVETIKSGGLILGMLDDIGPLLTEDVLDLNKGDKILLYTDGATEARNPDEELFGLPRIVESFHRHYRLPIKDTVHNIHQDIKNFISTRDQYDDITLVGIEKE